MGGLLEKIGDVSILAVGLAFDTWDGSVVVGGWGETVEGSLQARQCGLPRSHYSGHNVSGGHRRGQPTWVCSSIREPIRGKQWNKDEINNK